jgi:hypothetical protein
MARKKTNVIEMETPQAEVPKAKKATEMTDAEIFGKLQSLQEAVVSERMRRKKAGEKYHQLDRVVWKLTTAVQTSRLLPTGGKSPRIAHA